MPWLRLVSALTFFRGGVLVTRPNWCETFFFVVLILLAVFILLRSSLFEVRCVTVLGNRMLAREEVVKTAGIPLGANIFRVQLGEAERRVETLTVVKEASLKRHLPGTIEISITERTPVALVEMKGQFWSVDSEGVPLRREQLSTQELPLLTVGGGEKRLSGKGLRTISLLPPEVVREFSEVHVSKEQRVVAYTLEGFEIRLGEAQNPREQGLMLIEILQSVRKGGRAVSYIDLSDPRKAVVMYADQ
ncbi:MAG: cell division protein FtsQ/DivIB [Bacillota bacterium]